MNVPQKEGSLHVISVARQEQHLTCKDLGRKLWFIHSFIHSLVNPLVHSSFQHRFIEHLLYLGIILGVGSSTMHGTPPNPFLHLAYYIIRLLLEGLRMGYILQKGNGGCYRYSEGQRDWLVLERQKSSREQEVECIREKGLREVWLPPKRRLLVDTWSIL